MPDTDAGVKCEKCGRLPQIAERCGDNGSSYNGCEYRLECNCRDKDPSWRRSEMMAVMDWERQGFKSN